MGGFCNISGVAWPDVLGRGVNTGAELSISKSLWGITKCSVPGRWAGQMLWPNIY